MVDGPMFEAQVNPLAVPEIDEPWAPLIDRSPDEMTFLRFLCAPGAAADLESLTRRYREISVESPRLDIVPVEQRLTDKLVAPLRHAKASYVVGNYLATIALCGIVVEMLAILIWELADRTINNGPMTQEREKQLLGSSFERLSQDRRAQVLRAYEMISQSIWDDFEAVRLTRRKYLHLWSQDHDGLAPDAITTFKAAVRIVASVLRQDVQEGRVMIGPQMAKYLERRGAIRAQPE